MQTNLTRTDLFDPSQWVQSSRIVQIVQDCFGTEQGAKLLRDQAIVPTMDKRPAPGIVNHNAGVDLSGWSGQWNGLAVLNGPRSGITTIDVDTHDLIPPTDYNVMTRKGGHLYLPFRGERRDYSVNGIDVLGEGGYSIFHGAEKRFMHARLAAPEVADGWLESLKLPIVQRVSLEDVARDYSQRVMPEGVARECMYPEKLRNLGYNLRVETISKTLASQIRNTREGNRYNLCFRYALEVIRCGADMAMFRDAALESGIDEWEVDRAIGHAEASIDFNYREEVEMLTRVQGWLDAHSFFTGRMLDVANCLAFEAIECNTSRPQLSQTRAAVEMRSDQPYVGRVLSIMARQYKAVEIHVPPGRQADGRSHCNNYQLTIGGQPI